MIFCNLPKTYQIHHTNQRILTLKFFQIFSSTPSIEATFKKIISSNLGHCSHEFKLKIEKLSQVFLLQ
jgi:hypothetical protein